MALAKPCAAEAGPRLRAARRNRGPGSAKRHEECRIAPGTRDSLVIAGLDPVIHPLRKSLSKRDGCAGPGYAKASPGTSVSGRRSFSEDGKPAHDEKLDCFVASAPRNDGCGSLYRSNAALRRLSCGTSGLPIGARSVDGAWMVVSRRRTFPCKVMERAIRTCNWPGSFAIMSGAPGSAAESFTLVFSRLAWVSVISPSLTARCSKSHDASCISRVVSRMLSVA